MKRERELESALQVLLDIISIMEVSQGSDLEWPEFNFLNRLLSKQPCICPSYSFPHSRTEDCFKWLGGLR